MSNDTKPARKPTHELFAVKNNTEGKGFWTKIGAAWAHKDGNGFDLLLNLVPLDGRIVMREADKPKA